jgi:hypothetical protein
MSLCSISLMPGIEDSLGIFYIFKYYARLLFGGSAENLTSINFFGFKLLCQYVEFMMGLGIVTPAV